MEDIERNAPARPALPLTDSRVADRDADARAAELFLRGSSEALRTRFATVKGFAQLVQRHVSRASTADPHLIELTERLNRETLAFEHTLLPFLRVQELQWRPETLRREPLNLAELTGQVVSQYRSAPERTERHTLLFDASEPAPGAGDAHWLAEALGALLSNALKYSPDGGEIRVRLRREGNHTVVTVSDPGIGVAPDERARIFDPFVRGSAAQQLAPGVGLGLFIADRVARRHGGEVELRGSAGQGGSVFVLRLPSPPGTSAAA